MNCRELYKCCDCGETEGDGCGCRYCFSCHACENCIESNDDPSKAKPCLNEESKE